MSEEPDAQVKGSRSFACASGSRSLWQLVVLQLELDFDLAHRAGSAVVELPARAGLFRPALEPVAQVGGLNHVGDDRLAFRRQQAHYVVAVPGVFVAFPDDVALRVI